MRVEYASELSVSHIATSNAHHMVEYKGTEGYRLLHGKMLQSFKEVHKTASIVAQILQETRLCLHVDHFKSRDCVQLDNVHRLLRNTYSTCNFSLKKSKCYAFR